MKCAEMNVKGLRETNVDEALETVVAGSGTYEEIKAAVDNGLIGLLKDSQGNVTGISYNSGKTGIEDTLEGLKFEKRYQGHDVMMYVYKALTGNDIPEYRTERSSSVDELPTEIELNIEEELDGDASDKSIAKYLRESYGHYLSGTETPFQACIDEENEETVNVTEIHWGRKR